MTDRWTAPRGYVVALFVDPAGPYVGQVNVDPWDEERDARTYAGSHPVVAHPPCERWGGRCAMSDEDLAEPFLDLDTKRYPFYRIWASSKPLLDSTPQPAKGTVGFHVHAWMTAKAWAEGHASINQTYAVVNIDGRPWGQSNQEAK